WDKEKNKLLEAYGYSLNDELKGKFEFSYKDGKPFLRVLDPSIKRIAPTANARPKPEELPAIVESPDQPDEEIQTEKGEGFSHGLGIVFNLNHTSYPFFLLEGIRGELHDTGRSFIGKVEK